MEAFICYVVGIVLAAGITKPVNRDPCLRQSFQILKHNKFTNLIYAFECDFVRTVPNSRWQRELMSGETDSEFKVFCLGNGDLGQH